MYPSIFKFLDSRLEDERFCTEWLASIPWLPSAFSFFLNRIFICEGCSQIFELFHPVKGTIVSLHNAILILLKQLTSWVTQSSWASSLRSCGTWRSIQRCLTLQQLHRWENLKTYKLNLMFRVFLGIINYCVLFLWQRSNVIPSSCDIISCNGEMHYSSPWKWRNECRLAEPIFHIDFSALNRNDLEPLHDISIVWKWQTRALTFTSCGQQNSQ